ncbi:M24 family metallopeptidase [Selenomonas sp. KH1T6]|uniref:M24 family metallopeptidase n=1 Tax=Selenomonas sp. KH1T6 TaxID=3158784 RepID=UPI0008A7EB13|nr:Xaa-Pro aminopeptidase/Xaa-Pro dipeptidase [Selenomonas ruminantium]
MIKSRLEAVRALLTEQGVDAVVVTKYVNLHYFSGFRGDDTTLVISRDKAALITDNRYTEQAGLQAPLFEIVEQQDGLLSKTAEVVKSFGCRKVAFEGNALIYDDFQKLTELLEGVEFRTAMHLDKLREIKDAEEISYIRKACEIADKAFAEVLSFIRPGVTELAVAARLENAMRENGSEKPSFTTIVASGLRGSLPHGTATDKVIEAGELVTMDFGGMYQGYCSDITRTICVGPASEKQRFIYSKVLEAQKMALTLIKPGAAGKAVDQAVREALDKDDLGKYFGHGLGHSLGLEIHESPRLSKKSTCNDLRPGMLVTDEPGVYIPCWGGLRIEDTVLVTETGSEALTRANKEFIEIPLN